MTYLIKPEVSNGFLKEGLGRWLRRCRRSSRAIRSGRAAIRRSRRTRRRHVERHRCELSGVQSGLGGGQRSAGLGRAEADVIRNGMTPEQATDAAFKKIEAILGKYPIAQT